ncbi:hypothetical protein CERZMDRAFT_113662 [Cercospora zeae-maydis SCOH1-5]|uniref:Major facilitator superfamily (MFS) profile domain-containing protein n=1 Tax=Cercospora zeae-maydis SCOH1-5 TaxID=717836 RepID=A0A6A6F985_9PEZI|nr:hypothetical protein CERZMDRAFT_113662 [Cercospora zeae-maydis SCOH1-5]
MATTTVVETPTKAPETHELRTADEDTIEAGAAPAQNLKISSAAIAFFNAGINDGSLGALIPYILRHYDISTGWMAIPYGISFLGWLLAAVFIAYIRLSFGAGGVLVMGALLQLLAQLVRFWTPPFGLLAFSFFPICLGQGLQDSQANTFVSMIVKAHRWLGVIHGSYSVGGLCGPLLASAIASNLDGNWAAFYYVPTGIGALNLALCIYAFRDDITIGKRITSTAQRLSHMEQRRSKVAWRELKGAMNQKSVWLLSAFFFLYIGAALTMGGWIVEYLVEVRGGDLSQVGYIGAAFNGGTALGRFILAEPTFHFGEKRTVMLYTLICVVLQIVFWRVPNIIANAVIVCIMGFFLGPLFATGISVGSKLMPHEVQQSGLAVVFVMAQAGGSMFPAITGVIAAEGGVGTLQPILIGLLAALAISWFVINPTKLSTQ